MVTVHMEVLALVLATLMEGLQRVSVEIDSVITKMTCGVVPTVTAQPIPKCPPSHGTNPPTQSHQKQLEEEPTWGVLHAQVFGVAA